MARKLKQTAMLVISREQSVNDAVAGIKAILSMDRAPETLQEAMRTLAAIGKPPQNVNISHCTFKGKP